MPAGKQGRARGQRVIGDATLNRIIGKVPSEEVVCRVTMYYAQKNAVSCLAYISFRNFQCL